MASWRPVGLAFLMLVENLFPPIPSELVLPLAGFLVESEDLRFFPSLIASTLSSLAGALILYTRSAGGAVVRWFCTTASYCA